MNSYCDFCGAIHSGPNEPGSCVKYWQRRADAAEVRIGRLAKALRDADHVLQYTYAALDEVRQVEATAKIRRTALKVGQDGIHAALRDEP